MTQKRFAGGAFALRKAALLLSPASAVAQCSTSARAWNNTNFAPLDSPFTVSFDAVPNKDRMDGVTGLSLGNALAFKNLAIIVRFNHKGKIDARNGEAYAPEVSVTPPGGSPLTLGSNFAFRTAQAKISSLNNWALYADAGSHKVCNFSLTGGKPAAPAQGENERR
jgi:hypothetical protein